MKKNAFILTLLLTVSLSLFAEHVDPETARKVATTFLNNNGAKSNQLVDLSKTAGFQNLYIFTTEESFVIMAADDCVQPILGYSLTGKFVTENMPENVSSWLQGYNDEIQYAVDNQFRATSETSQKWKGLIEGKNNEAKVTTVVGPLIQTQWNQNKYYNRLCPVASSGPDGHAYTGCVATAMAQIMYYHKHPTQGIGSHSYVHYAFGEQSANFSETTYDWSHMSLTYNNNSTEEQKLAVATLMYHCGVSVNMDYGADRSGAQSIDIPQALINYFDYSVTANLKNRYPSDSTAIWIADLKAELDAHRPMEYFGYGSGGHAFVCDGYDSSDNFHFNWGWGGSYNDGYYSLDDMTPGTHNYNYNQGAIFGIKPATCAVSAPTGFSATLTSGTKNVTLAWTAVSSAVGYKIFRNGTLIGTATSSDGETFVDEGIPYGTYVYHVRSVDSNGEMSLPSDYKTISHIIPAPTEFEASLSATTGTILLSWNASEGASKYNIYCNEVLIASNVSNTSYEDAYPISGELIYSVKGVDVSGDEANTSATTSINVPYKTPIVNDLSASISNQEAVFSWTAPEWCYPETSTEVSYGDGDSYLSADFSYYAHRYPANLLTPGKSVYKVSIKVKCIGTYTVYVYTNTVNNKPDANALADTRVLKCSLGGWIDIPFSHPIPIVENQDLWIVVKPEVADVNYPISCFQLSSYNANACIVGENSEDPTDLESYPGYNFSWYIKAHLTDGTYTYNLYQDGSKIAKGLSTTSSNASLSNDAVNLFTVTTNYYGGETSFSNQKGFAKGSATLTSLTLSDSDKMTLTNGSTLTVTGSLTNTNADNLILEDGAQLIHHSDGVKATVKRSITTYTSDSDGWYTIAAPFTEFSPTQVATGSYDLYAYDEDGEKEWINYKAHLTDFPITQTNGYLYAHSPSTTINMTGTLNNGDFTETVNLSYGNSQESIKGYNLLGNPTTHDITFTKSANVSDGYYYLENGDQWVYSASNTVPSGRGFLVKAEAPEQSVTLNQTSREKTTDSFLCIKIDNQKTYVKMGEGVSMPLLDFKGKRSNTYLIRNGQPYIMLVKDDKNEIPVCFKAPKDGEYTLTVSTTPNSQLATPNYLHLVDNLTGADIDLLQTPNYSFNALADDYESRFKLVFSESEVNDPGEDEFDITDDSLEILDVTGRVVATDLNTKLTPGVYILKNANNNKTKKIIIN